MIGLFTTNTDNSFKFNGVPYHKIFVAVALGSNAIKVVNAYDSNFELLPSTDISDIQVDGVVYTTQADLIDVLKDLLFVGQSSNAETEFIWANIRNTDGVWSLLENETNQSQNVLSIEQEVNGDIIINYNKTYSKAGIAIVNPDEAYAKNNVTVGASQGLNRAVISASRSYSLSAFFNFNGDNFISSRVSELQVQGYSNGVITINHDRIENGEVSLSRVGTSIYEPRILTVNNNLTRVQMYVTSTGIEHTGAATTEMNFFLSRSSDGRLLHDDPPLVQSNLFFFAIMYK
ncbi:hypothetical protein N9H19_00835 [Flavobacteriales bacterium]|nr:hypothetical protein [Flavobacteriales bacterium]